jgi:hypothetical protein
MRNERQYFSKNVIYLLALFLSVIRIQNFHTPYICLLVVISIIFG